MANELKVFEGPYVPTIGVPLIFITGYSRQTSQLSSEYYIMIRGNNEYYAYKIFHYSYESIPPHPIIEDVDSMMNHVYQKAQIALGEYIHNKLTDCGMTNIILQFKEIHESILSFIYLLEDQPIQLAEMKKNADSPYVISVFQRLEQFPKLIEEG